jgi:hypothetical protein
VVGPPRSLYAPAVLSPALFRTFLKILRVFGVSVESKEDMLFKM